MRSSSCLKAFPPYRLDTINQCLWRGREGAVDERVLLSPTAFAILRYLVDNAGQLVTHEELLRAVWGDIHVQRQAVKRHMLDVRNALADDAKNPTFIETLPRRGYRFIGRVNEIPTGDPSKLRATGTKLVGREQPLGELHECFRRAVNGQRQIVFVTGEPGIGKTALLDEFEHEATANFPAARVSRGQCIEGFGSKEAYYPVLQALGGLGSRPEEYSLLRILVERAPTWLVQLPSLAGKQERIALQREIAGATKERMLREACQVFETTTAESALLLILEDLQWVDPSTVDLISALARGRASAKLMVIGTYRPADLALSGHPLRIVEQELAIHHLSHKIALDPLGEPAVAEFLGAGSSKADSLLRLARVLHQQTDGNPLFMVAALELMTERNFVAREDGCWRLLVPIEDVEFAVPENLRSMIEAQIDRLDEEQYRVLEVASVAGTSFASLVCAEVVDLDLDAFQDVCERVARRNHLIRATATEQTVQGRTSSCYEFIHALYRQVFYERIPPGRRVKLHSRVGESLERIFSDHLDGVAPVLAHHFDNGLDWNRAVKYLRLSAGISSRRFAQRETAEALERSLELIRKLDRDASARAQVEVLGELGAIYAASFETLADSTEAYDLLASLAGHHGFLQDEFQAIVDIVYPLAWIDSQRACAALNRALKLTESKQETFQLARAEAANLTQKMQDAALSTRDAEECRKELAKIRKRGDRFVLLALLENQIATECDPLDCWAAVTFTSERGRCRYMHLLFGGDWNDALKEVQAGIAVVSSIKSHDRGPMLDLCRAWVHLCGMDFTGVLAICVPMLESESNPLRSTARRFCQVLAGSAEIALGHCDSALRLLLACEEEMDRHMLIWDWYWRMALQSALTEVWLKNGDLLKARSQADVFMNVTVAAQDPTWHALAWEAKTRVALAEGDHKGAQDCNAKAFAAIHGFDLPLAAWRVHATAAKLYQATGNPSAAQRSQELSRAIIVKLANGLEEPLRQSFLSGTSPSSRASSVRLT